MKPWLLLAVAGHLTNAAAFIIDKTLLSTSFKRSASYAAAIGVLSFLTVVAIPWIKAWPAQTFELIAYGALFPFALWTFFEALKRSEPSRVVPIVGSLVPIFTLLGTINLTNERLTTNQLIGFVLLLLATAVLSAAPSATKNKRSNFAPVAFAVLSALLFAASSTAGKIAYGQASFLGVFVTSRLWVVVFSILILLVEAGAREELRRMIGHKNQKSAGRKAAWLALVGQGSGAAGYVMVNAALAQGSAAIVNALQAVQYAAIVLVGWFGTRALQRALQEPRRADLLFLKSSAIFCLAVGLALFSFGIS